MKRALLPLALAALPLLGQSGAATRALRARPAVAASVNPGAPVRIARSTFTDLEHRFDNALSGADRNDPIDLLGGTRGLYLDDYGAVFTTEVSLVITPGLNPFRTSISKEEATRIHDRKVVRLPLLRRQIREMVQAAAAGLPLMPDDQQVVVAVRLLYLPWEDTSGLPGMILMRADRKSAQAGQIHTEEQ
jgi:hypothetical protein